MIIMEELVKQILGELQKVNNRLDRLEKGSRRRLQTGQEETSNRTRKTSNRTRKTSNRTRKTQTGQENFKQDKIS